MSTPDQATDDRPLPDLASRHQPGITDPQWPAKPPPRVDPQKYALLNAGRLAKQDYLAIAIADIEPAVNGKAGLKEMLRKITAFNREQMALRPAKYKQAPLTRIPPSYRVTVTLGFGSRLFRNEHDDDRFGIDSLRPRELKPMPHYPGDAPGFDPEVSAGDLIFLISSDHPYVNVAIIRAIDHGYACTHLRVKHIELGYNRPDTIENLKFDDGTNNPTNATPERELDKLVYVHSGDNEPEWCSHGSYLVYRKILEDLERWEKLTDREQEQMIGRRKKDGKVLTRHSTGPGKMVPVYWDAKGRLDPNMRPNAHILKSQPRRPGPDFTGTMDTDRRFLRRPYPFFSEQPQTGDRMGKLQYGLQFLAFMRNLGKQFEWVTRMWQMNPDFPFPGAGIDALYANKILSTIGGGYYFCPPAPKRGDDFLGSELF